MKKTTKTLIRYYFPSLLFSAEADEEIKTKDIPAKLPKNCFAFRFGTQEVVVDGKDVFEKPAKWDNKIYMIGETIPLAKIPKTPENSILRSNIECNSPTKTAIKTHLGNWQAHDRNTTVLPVSQFSFESRWV